VADALIAMRTLIGEDDAMAYLVNMAPRLVEMHRVLKPTWTITDHAGRVELIEADRIEADGNGWSWWSVILVVNEPRWSCVRRVSARDAIGEPFPTGQRYVADHDE